MPRFFRNINLVAFVEAIVVVVVDRQPFIAAAFTPGINKQTAGTANNALHLITPDDGGGMVGDVLGRIQPAVQKNPNGKDKRNRNQAGKEVFEGFDFLASASAILEKKSEAQSGEKHDAKKHQHGVQIQGRINLADIREDQRARQENCGLGDEPAAEDKLRSSRGQSASGTLVRGALGATIKTASHHRYYTAARNRLRVWRANSDNAAGAGLRIRRC
jgi:hypothetical protein